MKTITTILVTVIMVMLTTSLNAQTFEMVKDLNPNGDSTPAHLTVMDNHLFFVADFDNGQWTDRRLWVTDGTEGGTQVIDGGQENLVNTEELTPFDEELYFSSGSEDDGNELWKTDANGQVTLVKNINSALYQGSNPAYSTVFDNKIYFSANDGTNGDELWVTDGTTAGTQMLKDINPAESSYPWGFTEYNDKLYFSAKDGINVDELWVTDGTVSGTQMLKDIHPLSRKSSNPYGFTEYNSKLYFSADDGANGNELWVTDGTTAGTQMLKDINPSGNSYPSGFTEYNDKLYFSANDGTNNYELWVTDGTEAGTHKIHPDIAATYSPMSSNPYFTKYDDSLYFSADSDGNGVELWKLTAPNMSVEEVTTPEFSLYPNPVKDILQIKTNQEVTSISLYLLNGQKLQTWKNQDNIDLSTYAKGIYLVKIQTPESTQTKKNC